MKKIINYLVKNQTKLRDKLALLLFKLNLIPKEFEGRVKSIYLKQKYNKKFFKKNLVYNNLGFYHLEPMPSSDFLTKYYSETYWQSRTDKNYPIRLRDLEHYKILKKKFPNFNNHSKKILNFGAGHGGISFFLHAANHDICNLDPGGIKEHFSERWKTYNDLSELDIEFDLIYGSHSIEHVQDIKKTLKQFKRLSHKNTIFFFEVPNCPKNKKISIEPPHTYYFNEDFFKNSFDRIEFCKSFTNYKERNDNNGDVLVFISQTGISNNI